MFWNPPAEGDWVTLTNKVPVSFTDSLTGGGLERGTRGVVVDRIGSRLKVKFDSGLGAVHATVSPHDTRVIRRRGGVAAFDKRTRATTALRLGVIIAFVGPFILYAAQYAYAHHSTSGLIPALLMGVVEGTLDMLGAALANPIQAVLYLVATTLLWRWAWRH